MGDYEVYVDAAINIGQQLAAALGGVCDFTSDPSGCTQTHLGPALRVLYRGAVTQEDLDGLSSVVAEAMTRTDDVNIAISHGVARSLLEPKFLYRLEEGIGSPDENGGLPVSSHEFASRLSFLVWEGPPDAPLIELADAGTLIKSETAREQTARALTETAARTMIWNFGDFADLLQANYSLVNAELAAFYGVPAPESDWDMVVFPEETKRRGVLTHASFLAANSAHARDISWIFRGKIVFEHMFCGEMPPPPEGAAETEVESRLTAPACKGCHTAVDPMGMFFDQFDEHGALMENVPTPGTVALGSDIDSDYPDVQDFVAALSGSAAFEHCFVKLWFQHALGRELAAVDQGSFDAALETLRSTGSVRQMLEAIVASPTFAIVYPKPEEVICE